MPPHQRVRIIAGGPPPGAAHVRKGIGVAQYEKTLQTAFQEVADGLAARGTFDDEMASLERYTAAERRRLELAQLLFKNGQASYLDVLTAQTDPVHRGTGAGLSGSATSDESGRSLSRARRRLARAHRR